jgi:hypothetical protein
MRHVALGVIALALVSACQKSDPAPAEGEKKTTTTAEARPAPTESKSAGESASLDGIPTEEDFVEAAETEITDKTDLEKELDSLEKEISQ